MSHHRKPRISHNNKKSREIRRPKALKRDPKNMSMSMKMRSYIDENGTDWAHMPEWKEEKGNGKPLPLRSPTRNPKLVGLISDIALGIVLDKERSSTLSTFMHTINNYSGTTTKTPVDLKWRLPEETRKEAIELLWKAKTFPKEGAIEAIARLCMITRIDRDPAYRKPLRQSDVEMIFAMVNNAKKFFLSRPPGKRGSIITMPDTAGWKIKGTPDWISDCEILEMKSGRIEPFIEDYIQLLGYLALAREQSKLGFDIYGSLEKIGVYSSKSDLAWSTDIKNLNENDLDHMAYTVLGLKRIGG